MCEIGKKKGVLGRRAAGCGADRLDLGAQPRWLRGCGGVQPYEMEKICKSSVTPGLNLLGSALRNEKSLLFVGRPQPIKAQTKDLYQPMYQFHGKTK